MLSISELRDELHDLAMTLMLSDELKRKLSLSDQRKLDKALDAMADLDSALWEYEDHELEEVGSEEEVGYA